MLSPCLEPGCAAPLRGGTIFGFRAKDSSTHSLVCELEMAKEFLNAVRFRPYVFLYYQIRLSVSVVFLGWRVRMSIIRTAKNPKMDKIRAKIRASIHKKPRSLYFLKKIYEVLKL